MMTFLGGLSIILVGLFILAFWWQPFAYLLKGGIPMLLIIGGALAAYLGLEEWKDSRMEQQEAGAGSKDAEKYQAEAESYKKELEELKKDADQPAPSDEQPAS